MPKKLIELYKQHRFFIIPYLIIIIIGLAIIMSKSKTELFLFTNIYHNEFFDHFFIANTIIGDGLTMILVGLCMLFIKFRFSVVTILAYAYSSVITQVIKRIVNEPRPSKFFEGLNPIRTIEGYPLYEHHSFPSGHSVSAFTLAVIIAYLLPIRHKHKAWIILPFAMVTAFSRVYLSQHFFSDIVLGAIFGVLLTFQLICWLENSKWYHSSKLDGRLFPN